MQYDFNNIRPNIHVPYLEGYLSRNLKKKGNDPFWSFLSIYFDYFSLELLTYYPPF